METYYDLESIVRIAAVPGILLGVIQCFFGYRVFKVILGILGFIAGGVGAGALGYALSESQVIGLVAGLLGGAIGAALLVALYYVGVFLIGAILGAGIASFLVNGAGASSTELLILVVVAVVSGIVALVLQKFMIIVSTGFLGAWSVVSGITYYAIGGDLAALERMLRQGGTQLYMMLLGALALGIAGIIVQYRSAPDSERVTRLGGVG